MTTHSTMSGTDLHSPKAHASTHVTGGGDTIASATTSVAGLMSSADKTKMSGIPTWITSNTTYTCNPSSGAIFNGDNALAQCIAALESIRIKPSATVTIQLQDGVYGVSTPLSGITNSHPDSGNIVIQGNTTVVSFDISLASNAPSTGSNYIYVPAGAYSPTDFAPGGNYANFIVYVVDSTANDGAYEVIAATTVGGDIRLTVGAGTVKSATKDGTLYLSYANHVQLKYNGSSRGFTHRGTGRITWKGIFQYESTGTDYACYADLPTSSMNISSSIISGFGYGLFAGYGAGIITADTGDSARNIFIVSNTGLTVYEAGFIMGRWCVISDAIYGLYVDRLSYADIKNSIISRSTTGVFSFGNSMIHADTTTVMHCTTGYYTSGGRIVRTSNSVYGNSADYNPAGTPPTEDAVGGWIL
jgi:hypothetical protein